jgi:hypothetical protein
MGHNVRARTQFHQRFLAASVRYRTDMLNRTEGFGQERTGVDLRQLSAARE